MIKRKISFGVPSYMCGETRLFWVLRSDKLLAGCGYPAFEATRGQDIGFCLSTHACKVCVGNLYNQERRAEAGVFSCTTAR